MRIYHFLRLFLLAFLCSFAILFSSLQAEEAAPAVESEVPQAQKPEQVTDTKESQLITAQKSTLVQFYSWATMVPKELIDLKAMLQTSGYAKRLSSDIPALTADIRDLRWELSTTSSAPYLRQYVLDRFQNKLIRLQERSTSLGALARESVETLSAKRNQWLEYKEKLESYTSNTEITAVTPPATYRDIAEYIREALENLDVNLNPALMAGKDLANMQMSLQTVEMDLLTQHRSYLESRTTRNSISTLSAMFYNQISLTVLEEIGQKLKKFCASHVKLITGNIKYTLIGLFIFILLAAFISLSRGLVKASSRWYSFSSYPVAASIFIIAALHSIFGKNLSLEFENQWSLMLNIITIAAVIRLARKNIRQPWKRTVFTRLSAYLLVLMTLAILEPPQILMLLFVFIASLSAFLMYLANLRQEAQSSAQRIFSRIWGILPAAIIIVCLAGYDHLAIFMFSTMISSITICLFVWMLFHLSCGLLELLLQLVPFTIVRNNIATVVNSVQPIFAVLYILFALSSLSKILDIYPSAESAITSIYNFSYDIGEFHISLGFVLTTFLVLYGTILFSKAIQSLLILEVLPRYKAGMGVQLSITRLVHYAILTIGFLVMLNALGFQLQQLTILGGALGVGIGFGLQAIINNFVSGLILLFERPIKVGDTIQVGPELGEVKSLGLRATIIQTFDNAEIVVPNSDLITGQVTNWTLAERQTRIRLPVGVAYGTDVAKVLDILSRCAEAHPMVLSKPKPAAFFLAFGASSLDFELRFWIPEYLDRSTAISELNQSIESEFAANSIEIPFPQTDLHIRSVTPQAAASLREAHGVPPASSPLT